MKKSYLFIKSFILNLFILLLVCSFSGCKKNNAKTLSQENQIVIYTYNSFSGEWGAGPKIAQAFYEQTGIKVVFADCKDGGQLLQKVIKEKNEPYADVVIGLDNNIASLAKKSDCFINYIPENNTVDFSLWDELNNFAGGNKTDYILIPYDWSFFTFIFNTKSSLPVPKSLEDLTKPIYKKQIILMNKDTSVLGLGFESWIKSVYGQKSTDYLERLKDSILTEAPSWTIGYGMFTDEEAPLVFSYTTSPAYHIECENNEQFKAIKFEEPFVKQIEGAAIVRNSKNLENAKLFIDFLIQEQAQKEIPLTQWMYPANKNISLPKSYLTAEDSML